MLVVKKPIPLSELQKMAKNRFGDLVKAVVDVERSVMALDAELHADEEAELLKTGSDQKNLWGINLYPDIEGDEWIEFDSMINLRPSQGNKTRGVDDAEVRQKIKLIVKKLIK